MTNEEAYAAAWADLARKEGHFPGLPPSPAAKPQGVPKGTKRPPKAPHAPKNAPR